MSTDIRDFFFSSQNKKKADSNSEKLGRGKDENASNIPIGADRKNGSSEPRELDNSQPAKAEKGVTNQSHHSEPKHVSQDVAELLAADKTQFVIPADVQSLITWAPGEPVPYLAVVEVFEEIAKVSGRLDKENLFSRLFQAVVYSTPSDLEAVVYLASNEVSPVYEGMELGIGDSLLVKAVCEATGRKKDAVEEAYEREGDLGTVALLSRASQKTLSFAAKPKPLHAKFVLEQFRIISQIKGEKAQGRKVDVIKSLMVKCQGSEAKYIVRALQGKLRIGTAQQTVLVALSHAISEIQLQLIKGTVMDNVRRVVNDDAKYWKNKQTLNGNNDNDDVEENDDEHSNEERMIDAQAYDGAVDDKDQSEVLNRLLESVEEKVTPEAVKLKAHAMCWAQGTPKAVSQANQILNKEARWQCAEIAVKRAFSECPNLTILVKSLLIQPMYNLHRSCCLTIGLPVAPMLARPTKQIGEVLRRLSGLAFTMEYKYDGERAQVHLLGDEVGTVKIYSRNSEDNSEKYPDLRDVVLRAKLPEVHSCILDAEVVAYDREAKALLPFQILSTRKRKVDAGEEDNQKVKVILQIFDLLYINGKSLLRESLRTRRRIMQNAFQHNEGLLHFASGSDHVENGDTAPIEAFLQEACVAQCEGLMVKTLDSNASYEPSKRSLNWLKLKKDYIEGMGVCDSVDLVVIGGYLGRGKRTNTYGAYLMACYDPDNDEYQSVCKVGTGFKDDDLSRFYAQMQDHILKTHKRPLNYNVSDALTPDHWFEAVKVWECQAADLSKSSVHSGGFGRVDSNGTSRGIGLRFPRFIRERDDKRADQATTAEQIVDMFYNQALASGENADSAENGGGDDDDWL